MAPTYMMHNIINFLLNTLNFNHLHKCDEILKYLILFKFTCIGIYCI